MSPAFYHIAHLVGALSLFIGFGAMLSAETAKSGMKWHGIGLVILLVTGFGQLAKLGLMSALPHWVMVKMVLWLVLGFLPVVAKKGILSRCTTVGLALAIGGSIGWLCYLKPAL